VRSQLVHLDRNPDGTVQVPTSYQIAGWYDRSVTAGQVGPTVILGHVDSKAGPGIFYRLGALHPGDTVTVTRTDHRTVTYTITGVREYAKNQFPTIDVYGNTTRPTIRLVTCGGTFDHTTGHYLSNIVAYGELARP
jgi:sortase (surface protein transpeptidase)